jgi:hypothetical protein
MMETYMSVAGFQCVCYGIRGIGFWPVAQSTKCASMKVQVGYTSARPDIEVSFNSPWRSRRVLTPKPRVGMS